MIFPRTLHPRIRHSLRKFNRPGHNFARRAWLIAALLLLTSLSGAVAAVASAPDAARQITGRLPNATVFVFLDLNENGTKTPTEPGIGDVTVILQDENGTIIDTRVTDNDGTIGFPDRIVDVESDYFMVVTVPEGYTNTSPTSVQIEPSEDGSVVIEFGLKLLAHELYVPTVARD
ncbi:MAG: SdrD B-like domain-containing protein [Litorilinea sp.]